MRIRLIEKVGFWLPGSTPDLPERQAQALINEGKAIAISDSHKSIEKPPKDKMVRKRKTKEKVMK